MTTTAQRLRYFESVRLINERTFWAALSIVGRPDGFLDVGCGDGWVVRTAFANAIKPSIGVESDSEICANAALGAKILTRRLDHYFQINGYFDLVFALRTDDLDLEGLGVNLINHTNKWLVCVKPWPINVINKLKLHPEYTQRLQCATQLELGVFTK